MPQCITIVSGFCLIIGTAYNFMSSFFPPEKCRTTNLFSLWHISRSFISLIIVSNENNYFFNCYRFFDFLSFNEIWNYILFFVSDFPLLRKNNFSLVLIESLASGVSFNDWPFETQSNLLNVVIGSLFEFCDFINLQWVLSIFKLFLIILIAKL